MPINCEGSELRFFFEGGAEKMMMIVGHASPFRILCEEQQGLGVQCLDIGFLAASVMLAW